MVPSRIVESAVISTFRVSSPAERSLSRTIISIVISYPPKYDIRLYFKTSILLLNVYYKRPNKYYGGTIVFVLVFTNRRSLQGFQRVEDDDDWLISNLKHTFSVPFGKMAFRSYDLSAQTPCKSFFF